MRKRIPKLIYPPLYTEDVAEREREKARKFQQQLINIDINERKIQQETWATQQMEEFIQKLNSQ